ncbi:hypothetical protein BDV59DRAFT_178873 [Aspergillus ambiguus]|uniref:uncharacterized protein n=1 Tax=Aspergillus ambiguus TaxID=176160 RepID=UPI003CCD102C
MDLEGHQESKPETLSHEERQAFRRYGRLPRRGSLLGHHPRKYFDSGDFAVSTPDRMKDNDAIQTGKSHPLREAVSHPFSRVPFTGNVSADANEAAYMERKHLSSKMVQSGLHNEIDDRDIKAGKGERPTRVNEDRKL